VLLKELWDPGSPSFYLLLPSNEVRSFALPCTCMMCYLATGPVAGPIVTGPIAHGLGLPKL
jgi:hypothetical protein